MLFRKELCEYFVIVEDEARELLELAALNSKR